MAATNRAVIDAPVDVVWGVLYDVDALLRWQPDLTDVRCIRRDELGRPVQVEMVLKTVIRTTRAVLNMHHEPGVLRWDRHSGDVPNFSGAWRVQALSEHSTAVEYELSIDFGRLGKLVRGPIADAARDAMGSSMPGKLKSYVESVYVVSPARAPQG